MKTIKQLFSLTSRPRIAAIAALVLCLGFAVPGFAQTAATQTTLSAAESGGGIYSGNTPTIASTVTLASVTGLVAPTQGAITSIIYVDKEAEGVVSVNSTTLQVGVIRGFMGTAVNSHASGAMVLLANAAPSTPSPFQQSDPSGACTATSTPFTPWINVLTGNQWLCSTITGTWVPGFGNSNTLPETTTAVASVAGTTLPSGPLFHVTGTNAITAWGIPVGCDATAVASRGCVFTIIPDAAFTTTATNNIGLAVTAVAGHAMTWYWDAHNSLFYPIQGK